MSQIDGSSYVWGAFHLSYSRSKSSPVHSSTEYDEVGLCLEGRQGMRDGVLRLNELIQISLLMIILICGRENTEYYVQNPKGYIDLA